MNDPVIRRRSVLLVAVLAIAIVALAVGAYLLRPHWLTAQHGEEMRQALQRFHEVEGALQTVLHPELLLSVAARDYYTFYLKMNQDIVFCQGCDRFWVTTAVEVLDIQVMDYSTTRALVTARIWTLGHMVKRDTLMRFDMADHPGIERATYEFVRASAAEPWKLRAIYDYCAPPC